MLFHGGILHWLHLELVGAVSDKGEVRVIGNYIENNTYGVYTDFKGGPTGYFGVVSLGPNMTGREFPWIGFAQAILGPETLTKTFSIYNFTP